MHYAGVLFQQKAWFLGVMALTTLLGTLVIFSIPKVYSAQSSILIEQGTLSISGENTVNQQGLTHRVQAMFKTILVNENIEKILKKHGMVEANTSKIELQNAYSGFRKSAKLNFENAMVLNPYTGREGMASLGFSVQYENNSPELTYEIANELTNLLLAASKGNVSNKQNNQLNFLIQAKEAALTEVKLAESNLAKYKQANSTFLPEMQTLTIKRLDDLKSEISKIEGKISLLKKNEDELLATIATTRAGTGLIADDGTRITGNVEKLIILESEYAELSSKFTPHHPDIINLTEDIAALKKRIKKSEKQQKPKGGPANPIRELLFTRLDSARNEIQYEMARITKIQEEIKTTNRQIQGMPRVKEELQLLELQQQGVVKKYAEIEEKLVQAGLSKDLNTANLLDNFILLEAPQYPLSPIKPRKKILMAVLLMLAASLGLLVALIKDMLNDKIQNKSDLVKYVNEPVYMIPKAQ